MNILKKAVVAATLVAATLTSVPAMAQNLPHSQRLATDQVALCMESLSKESLGGVTLKEGVDFRRGSTRILLNGKIRTIWKAQADKKSVVLKAARICGAN